MESQIPSIPVADLPQPEDSVYPLQILYTTRLPQQETLYWVHCSRVAPCKSLLKLRCSLKNFLLQSVPSINFPNLFELGLLLSNENILIKTICEISSSPNQVVLS